MYLLNYSVHVFELYMISIQPISHVPPLYFLKNNSRAMRICVDGCSCRLCAKQANRASAHSKQLQCTNYFYFPEWCISTSTCLNSLFSVQAIYLFIYRATECCSTTRHVRLEATLCKSVEPISSPCSRCRC